jgi:hypothetical protein
VRVTSKAFSYTWREVSNIEATVSVDHFAPYVAAAGGNHRIALELYEWNSTVSGAFHAILKNVEIGLRNACHRELAVLYGPRWHDEGRFQTLGFRGAVNDAKDRLRRLQRPINTPNIVAECSFGFWTTMFARRFEHQLWNRGLRCVFPRFKKVVGHGPARTVVAARLHNVRGFRNRIAHYEPIFTRALGSEYASLIEVTAWIHPDFAAWTREVGRPCASLIASGSPVRRRRVIVAANSCGPQAPHQAILNAHH